LDCHLQNSTQFLTTHCSLGTSRYITSGRTPLKTSSSIVLGVFTNLLHSNRRSIFARISYRGNVCTESLPSSWSVRHNTNVKSDGKQRALSWNVAIQHVAYLLLIREVRSQLGSQASGLRYSINARVVGLPQIRPLSISSTSFEIRCLVPPSEVNSSRVHLSLMMDTEVVFVKSGFHSLFTRLIGREGLIGVSHHGNVIFYIYVFKWAAES
jgi:hypothetical protein